VRRIYLDHNATSPVRPEALEAMLPFFRQRFGNPSSIHGFGQEAHRALDCARQAVAALIHADPEEIIFTSGGTEADNQVLRGAVRCPREHRPHVVTSVVEHPAVLETCGTLEKEGTKISYVPVDRHGRVDPAAVTAALTEGTVLVSLMLANNDVGTIQPVQRVAALTRSRGILVHTDAVQAAGRVPLHVRELGVDLLSLSGHKLGGPKGSGALYVRRGVALPPLLLGGAQERRRRAGTENVPALVGFGKACEIAARDLHADAERMRARRDRLQAAISDRFPGTVVNGHPEERLPNTLNMSFPGLDGDSLIMGLDVLGLAVSAGSACASGTQDPSPVLLAMGLDRATAGASVRFSLGPETTEADIDGAVEAVTEVVRRLHANSTGTERGIRSSRSEV
jgi:cysteine desulfurase